MFYTISRSIPILGSLHWQIEYERNLVKSNVYEMNKKIIDDICIGPVKMTAKIVRPTIPHVSQFPCSNIQRLQN